MWDPREERSQAVAGGWNPPFVALASLEVQKQKSRVGVVIRKCMQNAVIIETVPAQEAE